MITEILWESVLCSQADEKTIDLLVSDEKDPVVER